MGSNAGSGALSADFGGMEGFTSTAGFTGSTICVAGSADAAAMNGAVGEAMGPLGCAVFVPSFSLAMASNLAGTLLVGGCHVAIGGATEASKLGYIATDSV